MQHVNTGAYVTPNYPTPAVRRKIARARLFAAVEGAKGKTFPTPRHQSPLPTLAQS